jgi:hypothetical protein
MIAEMAGYAFRLRCSSYGGQVGSNPPDDAATSIKDAIKKLGSKR